MFSRPWVRIGLAMASMVAGLGALTLVAVADGADPVVADPVVAQARVGTAVPPTPPPTSASTTTTSIPDPVLGSGQPVVFAFGGDVHFEGVLADRLADDPASVFAPVAPLFALADVSMVNLETAITEGGEPVDKEYTFRAPAAAFDALRQGNIDVVTMANNHGLDFGHEGLEDTMAAIEEAPFPVVGVGLDAARAYAPWRKRINDQRIAILGASQVIDGFLLDSWTAIDDQGGMASAYDHRGGLLRLVNSVRTARAEHDTVVVYLHFGQELDTCPNDRQKALVDLLVRAGADIVVGSHTHRVQGGGRKGGAFVHYGLGNFAFYNESGASGESGVLLVTATGRRIDDYQWVPARIRGGVPTPLDEPDGQRARDAWVEQRGCTDLAE